MPRTDVHIKVVLDHEGDDNVEKLAAEICRLIEKAYAVQSATVSNTVAHAEE
ncbi:MAG TPA: hypothetical protein VFL57_01545 [Bryobacteraceae bacterium]|nr:hypothetical protein [Bryobacteraceae bacterium]